jgi:hypothetical protein
MLQSVLVVYCVWSLHLFECNKDLCHCEIDTATCRCFGCRTVDANFTA